MVVIAGTITHRGLQMRKVLLGSIIVVLLTVVLAVPGLHAAQCLINGDFEGAWVDGNPAGWKKYIPSVYCYSGYTADWQLFSDNLNGYPSLEPYAGRQSLGVYRVDGFQYNIARPQLEFYEFNVLYQYVKVEPSTTYNVKVGAAVFVHHDRMGDLDDFWGSGISLRICPDWNNHSQAISFWRHDFTNSEGDSFWRYYPDLNNTNGTNTFTTGPSQTAITFNIVWYTKWNADIDLCAIDNVSLELSKTGPASLGSSDFQIKDPPTWKDPHRLWNPVNKPERWSRAGAVNAGNQFSHSLELTTGVYPVCSAVGDINGDKLPDIAVACEGSHIVSLYLQQRDGSFKEGKHITGIIAPKCVQITQVVGSEAPDLVVSSFGTQEVLVYPGNGKGLGEPLKLRVPLASGWFDIADVNGDSHADLAVCGLRPGYDGEIYVFTGNGSGQFKQAQVISPVKDPSCLRLIDFGSAAGKLDGKPDIAVSTWWGPALSYMGNGDGTFASEKTLYGRSKSTCLSLSDLDGDKIPDACIPYAWTIGTMGHLQLAKGNGDCTFAAQEFEKWLPEPLVPRWVDTSDLNGDGTPDIVACNQETSDIAVFFNSRSAEGYHFDYSGHYGLGDTNTHVLCHDINLDGSTDILVCSGSSQTLSIVYGERRTAALNPVRRVNAPRLWQKIAGQRAVVADSAQPLLGVASLEYFRVYRSFEQAEPAEVYSYKTVQPGLLSDCIGLDSKDLNSDNAPDFVLTRTTGLGGAESLVFLSDSSGFTVSNYQVTEGDYARTAVLADVDGKNGPDIIALEAGESFEGVYCRLNDGRGHYGENKLIKTPLPAGSSPVGITTADFNSDGRLDVAIICSGSNEFGLMFGKGDGSFLPMKKIGTGSNHTGICSADFNKDGRVDLALTGSDGKVSVYTQDKDGSFSAGSEISLGLPSGKVRTDDVNADGIIDLLVACPLDRSVYLVSGKGDGTFYSPGLYRTGSQPLDVVVGQLTGSALPDMLVVSERCELFENLQQK